MQLCDGTEQLAIIGDHNRVLVLLFLCTRRNFVLKAVYNSAVYIKRVQLHMFLKCQEERRMAQSLGCF